MYTEFPVERRPIKISLKWVVMALVAIIAVCGIAFFSVGNDAQLATPTFSSAMRAPLAPCVTSGSRPSLAVDATYVMWKGAKKKAMKRPKKKGYDARRTAPEYDPLPAKPPQVVVVKAAK
ncbi:hypothetical protein AAMO2058_000107200 [Amorphochlora amoebiformis]